MSALGLLDVFCALAAVYIVKRLLTSDRRPYPLPPGPRRLPLIGNVLDIPKDQWYVAFAEWSNRYGTISVIFCLHALTMVSGLKVTSSR